MPIMDRTEIKIFITFFLIYAFFVHWDGWREDDIFALVRAVVDDHTIKINKYGNYSGDITFYNGDYYSGKLPGQAILAVPVYSSFKIFYYSLPSDFIDSNRGDNSVSRYRVKDLIGGYIDVSRALNPGTFILLSMILVTMFTSSIFGAFSVVLMYKFSKFLNRNRVENLFFTLSFGLGTSIFHSSIVFFTNSSSIFFSLLGLYFLFKTKCTGNQTKKIFLISGLLLGFSFVIDPLAIILIALSLTYCYFIVSNKKFLLIFLLGVFLISSINLVYYCMIFGSSSFILYDENFYPVMLPISHSRLGDMRVWITWPQPNRFFEKDFLPGLGYNILFATVVPYNGLFYNYPIFSLSLLSIFLMYKKFKLESILLTVFMIPTLIFIGGVWSGNFFSSKWLAFFAPFMFLPYIFFIKKFGLKIAAVILIYSLAVNFITLQEIVNPSYYGYPYTLYNSEFVKKIYTLDVNPLVDYYFPRFLQNGPRSKIFEGLISWKIPDIHYSEFNYNDITVLYVYRDIKLITRFLCLVPLTFFILIIWRNEILNFIKSKIKWMNFKILLLLFIVTSLILFVRF